MNCSCKDMEARMRAVEANQLKVQELINLLEDVKSSLRIFVKIGNGLKWIALFITSIVGAIIAIRKWI